MRERTDDDLDALAGSIVDRINARPAAVASRLDRFSEDPLAVMRAKVELAAAAIADMVRKGSLPGRCAERVLLAVVVKLATVRSIVSSLERLGLA